LVLDQFGVIQEKLSSQYEELGIIKGGSKMKKLVSILIFLLYLKLAFGQFSVIQDGEGETSLQLLGSNVIAINAAQTSIGFSIRPKKLTNINTNYWTITSSVNAKKGTSNIFKGGEFKLSGRFGGNYILDKTDYKQSDPNFIYQFFGIEVLCSRYHVFDSTKVFDDQIEDQTNIGIRINYGWNFENIRIDEPILNLLGDFTSGVSVSLGTKDNTDLIEQVEVITSSGNIYSDNSKTRTISTTTNAFDITKITTNKFFARFNFDFGKHTFNQRILANFHLTYAVDKGFNSVLNPAFGIFVTVDGAPLEAIAGIQIQTKDWFNSRNNDKNKWERTAIVLTAGFPFD
jgi:hypothetical protein